MHYNTINLVIGDINQNNKEKNEVKKIQTHLRYVKSILIYKDTSLLSEKQKQNRIKVINILQQYIDNGIFPEHNSMLSNDLKRLPRFIDHNNVHCAVGYLILKTVDEELPKEINNEYEYSFVKDIDNQKLIDWADEYGLTLEECAMIQPAYDYYAQFTFFINIPKEEFNNFLWFFFSFLSVFFFFSYSVFYH